jgi:ubiquinone/menaquinone biosynthesis C-methylase UbiE
MNVHANTPIVDLGAVKSRQQAAWGSGDYAVVGTTLQIVGETLCEAVDLRAGQKVLDVAAGNGNATLAAARRFAEVTSTDYVGSLLQRGRERAKADGFSVAFQEADAENLPFADNSFDAVLSTFGVMFTPNHEQAANEMIRVTRGGGRIGLANWTPDGFIGRLFKLIGQYAPPAPGVRSPALWGSRIHIEMLFRGKAAVSTTTRSFVFRYRSPEHWLEVFRTYYGPVLKTFQALDEPKCEALEADILGLLAEFNRAHDGTLVAAGEYLEVVATKTA